MSSSEDAKVWVEEIKRATIGPGIDRSGRPAVYVEEQKIISESQQGSSNNILLIDVSDVNKDMIQPLCKKLQAECQCSPLVVEANFNGCLAEMASKRQSKELLPLGR
jgi:hypothetical protein